MSFSTLGIDDLPCSSPVSGAARCSGCNLPFRSFTSARSPCVYYVLSNWPIVQASPSWTTRTMQAAATLTSARSSSRRETRPRRSRSVASLSSAVTHTVSSPCVASCSTSATPAPPRHAHCCIPLFPMQHRLISRFLVTNASLLLSHRISSH